MARPVPFGFKMAWPAGRADAPEAVIESLGMRNSSRSSWEDGVEALCSSTSVSEHPVFVTPSLDGWVLVASPRYFDEAAGPGWKLW